jgi:hypothetical protein
MAEEDPLDYARLVREALRDVPRQALRLAASEGLPGEHHFYLTFRTDAPGVELPAGLRQRYPLEMTIVLQQQFWGLEVGDDAFSVTLRFGGAPQRVTIPLAALTAFVDPSVPFGLRLAEEAAEAGKPEAAGSPEQAAATTAPAADEAAPGQAGEGAPKPGVVVDFKPRRS